MALSVSDTRTISGTILFDAGTTESQKQNVRVKAVNLVGGSGTEGGLLAGGDISFDSDSGAYSVNNLEPGRYRLEIAMEASSGWKFFPRVDSESNWAGFGTGEPYQPVIDVSDANRTNVNFSFDPAEGALGIAVQFVGFRADAPDVIATNIGSGEKVPFFVTGFAQGDLEGTGMVWMTHRFEAGTQITIHFELNGVVVGYYDGTETGTLSAAEAQIVTVPVWDARALTETYLTKLLPTADALVDGNRGTIRVPSNAITGSDIEVFIGSDLAGQLVYGRMFSTPTSLGAATVAANGYATFALPRGVTGNHRIAVTTSSGQIIGWGSIAISDADKLADKDKLAETGAASPIMLGAVAGGLILVGAALAIARRKQRA